MLLARDRVSAIKQALDDRATEINSVRVLGIEIDCGDDEFTIKIKHIDKYAHRPQTDESTHRFTP